MRIDFVSYSGFPQHSDNFIPNHGPAILATICRKKGISSNVLDLNRPDIFLKYPGWEDIADFLINDFRKRKPDAIGFTTWVNAYQDTAKIISRIREHYPDLFIFGGGYHVTWFEETFLENLSQFSNTNRLFDLLIIGEGELPITHIIEYLQNNRQLNQISGALYKEDGIIKRGAPQSFLPLDDPESTPMPDWDVYENLDQFWPILPVDISRGCCFHCIMCGHEAMSGPKLRSRKIEYVVDRMQSDMIKYGIRHFRISSSMFPRKLISEFTDELLKRNLHGLTWSCFAKPNDFGNGSAIPLLDKMKKSGCHAIFFGIESGDDKILKALGKNTTVTTIKNAIINTKKAGIKTVGSFMLGNPYETEESIQKTVDFIKDIKPDSAPSVTLAPLPRTELSQNPEKYNYTLHKNWKEGLMLCRVEHIQDPDKWIYDVDYYAHNHNGKTFKDYSQECGQISRLLHKEGISRVSDDVFLMADLLDKDVDSVFTEHAKMLTKRNMKYFIKEISNAKSNHF